MCQALMELVDELYGDRLKREKTELATEMASEMATEMATEMAKKMAEEMAAEQVAKEIAKEVKRAGIITIIEQICKKLGKSRMEGQIADDLEVDEGLVHQICMVVKVISLNASSEEIYQKWNEMYPAA